MSVSQWMQALDDQPRGPAFNLSREDSEVLKREGTLVPKGKHHESFKRCRGLLRDHLDIDIPGDADTASAWGHLEKSLAKRFSEPTYDDDDDESKFEDATVQAIGHEEGSTLTMSLAAELGHTDQQADRAVLATMVAMASGRR